MVRLMHMNGDETKKCDIENFILQNLNNTTVSPTGLQVVITEKFSVSSKQNIILPLFLMNPRKVFPKDEGKVSQKFYLPV